MCVAVPMRIISIDGEDAIAEIDGVQRRASLMLLGEDIRLGDFIIVHAGFAISRLDEEEAEATLAMMREIISLEVSQ